MEPANGEFVYIALCEKRWPARGEQAGKAGLRQRESERVGVEAVRK